MRNYKFLLFFLVLGNGMCHGQEINTDPLQFNTMASRSINQWVVKKRENLEKYSFGIICVDKNEGLVFNVVGDFTINNGGAFVLDTATKINLKYSKEFYYEVVIGNKYDKPIAKLPRERFVELRIKAAPNWLKDFNTYTDTLEKNLILGKAINKTRDYQSALSYLLKVYQVKPEYDSVVYELALAYNGLKQYKKTINILKSALKKDSLNALIYKEMGEGLMFSRKNKIAIKLFECGLTKDTTEAHNGVKVEMARKVAKYYLSVNNMFLYNKWQIKVKELEAANEIFKEKIKGIEFRHDIFGSPSKQ